MIYHLIVVLHDQVPRFWLFVVLVLEVDHVQVDELEVTFFFEAIDEAFEVGRLE